MCWMLVGAARNDANFSGRHLENAELRMKAKSAELGNDEQLAVGGIEETIVHRGVRGINVNGHALLHRRVAIAAKRDDAVDEVRLLFGNRQRIPAQLIRRSGDLKKRPAANQSRRNLFVGTMRDGRADAIGPDAAIDGPRCGKGVPLNCSV